MWCEPQNPRRGRLNGERRPQGRCRHDEGRSKAKFVVFYSPSPGNSNDLRVRRPSGSGKSLARGEQAREVRGYRAITEPLVRTARVAALLDGVSLLG